MILAKDEKCCINIIESDRRKNVNLIYLGPNKTDVVNFTNFYNFLQLCLFKAFRKKLIKNAYWQN